MLPGFFVAVLSLSEEYYEKRKGDNGENRNYLSYVFLKKLNYRHYKIAI